MNDELNTRRLRDIHHSSCIIQNMSRRRVKPSKYLEQVAVYGILVGTALFAIFPIAWAILTSLKGEATIFLYPPQWLPDPLTFENYTHVLYNSNIPRYFLNSVFVVFMTILLSLTLSSHGGYAAARFSFRGKNVLLFIILLTVMIPGIVVLIPLYLLATQVGLLDTYWGLILVYTTWQIPTVLWLMRGFFETIPQELEEAALIDGCSRLGAFYRIIWPLTRPGLAAAAIIVFVNIWNEFIIALTLTTSDDKRLLPVGLYYYIGAFGIEWGKLMAAVSLALIPIILLFIFLQRSFIKGLSSGSIKG
jgi:ABC-type glycerol-3-phosphate transport system permease component